MSSAKPTDSVRRIPSWAIVLALIPPGWVLILQINHWRVDPPVVFLFFAWASIVGVGAFLTRAAMAFGDAGPSANAPMELSPTEARRDELVREKRALLKAVKEIEFERDMGKISPPDADHIIGFYRSRAITVLKQLDALADGPGASGQDLAAAPVRDRIEREVKARLALAPKRPKKSKPRPKETA